jgi:hypothetical protein
VASDAFIVEMDRKRGSTPRTKVEFIDKDDNVTDISDHYLYGANFGQVRERAPDEIQSGQLDIVLSNYDDMFSEFISTSLLYQMDYHGAKIRVSEGFLLPDGTEEYEPQGVVFIDQLLTDPASSRVTLRCRDLLWRIMDQKLHGRLDTEVPVADGANIGDGTVTGVAKLAFTTVNQDWTLTCDGAGGDGVGTFDVVGSIDGNIGQATSGTEFVDDSSGVRFTIRAGATPWQVGDEFTFTLAQHPEWAGMNAGKIIWSILTGYSWDTDTQEPFSDLVFDLDHTQSTANVDIDFESFETAIAAIESIGVFDIKGYAAYDTEAVGFLQSLIVMFLGSLYTGNDGRIKLSTYLPSQNPNLRTFADSLKITNLSYSRSIEEIINQVTVNYKASDTWPWSSGLLELDGAFVDFDQDSIDKYKRLAQVFDIPWFSTSGNHVQDFASKLLNRYSEPPLNVSFSTGLDALLTQIGDRVVVSDEKSGLSEITAEVSAITKQFDGLPAKIMLRVRQDSATNTIFGAIGSEEDEGDGLSPQSDDYDTATDADKEFAYFSKVGNGDPPQYSIF